MCALRAMRCVALALPIQFAIAGAFTAWVYGQALPADNRQNTIRGTVVNAITHEPIGRALVRSSDDHFATLTDGEGHFEFELPKTETDSGTGSESGTIFSGPQRPIFGAGALFSLTARKPGFLDRPNENGEVQAVPGQDLTISLTPEALIKGRVTLSTNDAALGISVQIFSRQVQEGMPRWVPGEARRANSNGEFRFAELAPGEYKIATHELMDNDPATTVPGGQLYGFAPIYYPGVADFAAAGTIQLAAGQTVETNLSLVRQPYFPVGVPVTNSEPGEGMNITVSVQGHRGPGYSLGYNAEKQRIEGMLPNGNYLVEAATFGKNAATGAANLAVAGAPAESPGLALTRDGSISLNVAEAFTSTKWNGSSTWNDGKHSFSLHGPRAYLQARLEAADDFEQHTGYSIRRPTGSDDGSLVIEDVRPGRYWLRLNSSRGYVAAATMGGLDLLHQPLVVGPGSSTPIEITMRDDTAEIEGTVTGLTTAGGPASRSPYSSGAGSFPTASTAPVTVYCVPLPDSPGQFQQLGLSTGDSSASLEVMFSAQNLAPGSYRVLAFKSPQPNLPYRDAEAMRAYEAKGQVVHLAAGQKANVQVQVISNE